MRAPAIPEDCAITLCSRCEEELLNKSTFTRPQGQMDYQDMYGEHALTNWQVSSLSCLTSPFLSL
jgi:hypothetical protein